MDGIRCAGFTAIDRDREKFNFELCEGLVDRERCLVIGDRPRECDNTDRNWPDAISAGSYVSGSYQLQKASGTDGGVGLMN
ncbi:MAG: hypothetical protein ACK2UH_12365 [Candidatus Promineifilaceae bacterium]